VYAPRHELASSVAERFRSRILSKARRLLADEDAAQDVAQEVLLRVLATPEAFAFRQHPLSWLMRVTTNLCLNRLRDQARRNELLNFVDETALPSPERDLLVREALERIPQPLHQLAIYYFVEELTHAEIAIRLRVSPRTIGNRLAELMLAEP
jgi:RNA polymerase sigma factor (sigma-70 family)